MWDKAEKNVVKGNDLDGWMTARKAIPRCLANTTFPMVRGFLTFPYTRSQRPILVKTTGFKIT
jgi:hypothetical protein